jgi:hypothetical protein
MLDKTIQKWQQDFLEEGRALGREEGEKKGEARLLLRLLGSLVLLTRGPAPGFAGPALTASSNGVTGSSPPSAWSRCSRAEARHTRRPPGLLQSHRSRSLPPPDLTPQPPLPSPTHPPGEGETCARGQAKGLSLQVLN